MIRKIFGDDNKACGITINLLTKEDGTKFGKSEKGAIYLDANLTTPFEMYQFLYNQPDNQIEKLLKMLTFLSKKEIEDIMLQHKKEPFKRTAQKTLTQLIIEDIHGKEIYKSCLDISKAFYEGKIETLTNELFNEAIKSLPTTLLKEQKYNVTDLLVLVDVCKSKSQARELIKTKSISINNKIIDSFDFIVEQNTNKCMIIKKGKKNYFLIK
jgi:tyrosyl-tRNA synthetase